MLLVQKDVFAILRKKWQYYQKLLNFVQFLTKYLFLISHYIIHLNCIQHAKTDYQPIKSVLG